MTASVDAPPAGEHARDVTQAPARTARLTSIDALRGLVMIVMALDHTREYLGIPGLNPTDMDATTVPLFLTRWITHICAPTFFLLTGTGAFLALGRRTRPELSRYLLTRGLWLMLLEVTVLRTLAYQFNADYQVTMLIVIWTLGCAMVVLAGLVWLPLPAILGIGLVMVAGHNLLDGIQSAHPLWALIHRPGFVVNRPGFVVFTAYPLVPWVGVTALGYALGQVYRWTPERRRRTLAGLGAAAVVAFLVLRYVNGYGDPLPWTVRTTGAPTWVSFLDVTKQPPSLLFLLMTLGPALLILRALDRGTPKVLDPAVTFGRVPFFYFTLHFTLIHLIAVVFSLIWNGAAHWLLESPDLGNYPFTVPPVWGVSLPVVYAIWIGVVVTMYPLCRWFAEVKRRRKSAWLSYL